MIGKKSKFQEYEQNSRLKVQDKENSNSSSTGENSDGRREEGESSSSTLQHNKDTGVQDSEHEERFVAESIFEVGQKCEEEVEEIPEEIQQIEGKYTITRPATESTGKVEKSDGGSPKEPGSPLDQKGPIIITTQNIKSDTDLLWDEICNGVKGKNSGIPMGFNRLNRYLGLRKSIYTTIGAAAG